MKKRALDVTVACSAEEIAKFDDMLIDEHYLQASRPVGDYLRQVVLRDGEWVGLLAWGACSVIGVMSVYLYN